jgi:hypothetical protein
MAVELIEDILARDNWLEHFQWKLTLTLRTLQDVASSSLRRALPRRHSIRCKTCMVHGRITCYSSHARSPIKTFEEGLPRSVALRHVILKNHETVRVMPSESIRELSKDDIPAGRKNPRTFGT